MAASPRFLLAKEAWIPGVGAAWFLITVRARRPLAFLLARALLEGAGAWWGSQSRRPQTSHMPDFLNFRPARTRQVA